jgi:hypothetical protein
LLDPSLVRFRSGATIAVARRLASKNIQLYQLVIVFLQWRRCIFAIEIVFMFDRALVRRTSSPPIRAMLMSHGVGS